MMTNTADAITRRSIAFVLVVCLLAGMLATKGAWTTPIEHGTESLRNSILAKEASGNTVIVEIDSASFDDLPEWPWPRSFHGRLIDRLDAAGAKRIVFDITYATTAKNPEDDKSFAAAISRAHGKVVLPAILETNEDWTPRTQKLPIPILAKDAKIASIWVPLDGDSLARRVPFSKRIAGQVRPELATYLADMPTLREGTFPIDWSINPHSIPSISYSKVLAGKFDPKMFEGKTVLVGITMSTMGDFLYVPQHGRIPGLFIQATAAETLRHHIPVVVDQWIPTAIILACIGLSLLLGGVAARFAALTGVIVLSIAGPIALIAWTPFYALGSAPLIAAIAAIITQAGVEAAKAFLLRLTRAQGTGLPNLTAMRIARPKSGTTVAIRLRNQQEAVAILGAEAHADLLRRACERIQFAAGRSTIYQVDANSFAWRSELEPTSLGDALEAIHAIFMSGIEVSGRLIDTSIAIGVSNDPNDSIDEAVSTALAAAERAVRRSIPWEIYAADDNDARWRLSLLAELDQAINNGDLWVAYQPKFAFTNRAIVGAEALVRWNHPERGAIRPDHFIPIVESNGRIDRLTMFVLETAIRDFSRLDNPITVAVNISPRMLGRGRLEGPILDLLQRHGMDPKRLTLEVTESANLTDDEGIGELDRLRAAGVSISIDDYGTGQSTLSYLKRLPATELKIDRSFIQLILTNRSDLTMVDSTVKLAHQLGMSVVAEGVETQDILDALEKMDCDIIQGYHIGRPVPFSEFVASQAAIAKRAAA